MTTHIWSILTHKESLWVKWIHAYKLNGRSFWDVPYKGDMTWGWRKLLQIRNTIRPFIWHKIYNGKSTSMWFDNWCDLSPIIRLLSVRDITRSGLSINASVSDLISNDEWRWPIDWYTSSPVLTQVPVPRLNTENEDQLFWRDSQGQLRPFSVALVWDSIRLRDAPVTWFHVIWFPHCIPRHAFHMWLVINHKLKTQDRLRQWDVSPETNLNLLRCPLCKLVPDSHEHLFFECSFSRQVWRLVKPLAGMQDVSANWDAIVAWITPLSSKRTAISIIARLAIAATSYFIWQERNNRLFGKGTRPATQVRDVIVATVRLKLLTMKFKSLPHVLKLLDAWKMPRGLSVL